MHSGCGLLWKITKEDLDQKSNHHAQGKHLLAHDTATCWINWNPVGSVSWHRAPRCDFEAGKWHFHNRVYYSLAPVCCFGDRQWSKPCQCGGRGVVPATIKLWSAIFMSIITRICICSHYSGAQGAKAQAYMDEEFIFKAELTLANWSHKLNWNERHSSF